MGFRNFLESLGEGESDALSAIRTGLNLREDFWDDFKLLLNNSPGLSGLLDVPETKIITWREKIEQGLSEVKKADSRKDVNKKHKIIQTGN